jgi:hypothetical protein
MDMDMTGSDRHLFLGVTLIAFGALLLVDRLLPVEFEHGWPFGEKR